jgi:hypothetical protein
VAEVDTSIYRAPPPSGLAAMNPLQILDLANKSQEFSSQNQINDIVRQNIDATKPGGLNVEGATNQLKNSGVARGLLEGLRGMQGVKESGYNADTAGQNLYRTSTGAQSDATDYAVKRINIVRDQLGTLASKPSTSNRDVDQIEATMAAVPGMNPRIIHAAMDGVRKTKEGTPEHRDALVQAGNMAIGSHALAGRVSGPPDAAGAPTLIGLGQATYGGPQGMPTGLPPGEAEARGASAMRGTALSGGAATSNQVHADLENLKQYSKVLSIGGPTVEIEKKFGQLASRFGLPSTLTPDQLKSAEGFDKLVNDMTSRQAGNLGAATDQGRHMILGATPSSGMSAYGREGVIDMMQGNQDYQDAARKAWNAARANGAPAHAHDTFMDEFGKTADPRVFQFNRLGRENQQKFLSQLDPDDLPEFETKYKDAIAKKWVKPLKGTQ